MKIICGCSLKPDYRKYYQEFEYLFFTKHQQMTSQPDVDFSFSENILYLMQMQNDKQTD